VEVVDLAQLGQLDQAQQAAMAVQAHLVLLADRRLITQAVAAVRQTQRQAQAGQVEAVMQRLVLARQMAQQILEVGEAAFTAAAAQATQAAQVALEL
jgi:hypothetical protein